MFPRASRRSRLGAAVALLLATPAARPLAAQQALTLKQAIELTQRQGAQGRVAISTHESARDRNAAFTAGYLPSLSISGTTPNYTRSIVGVTQPDGTTRYLPIQQTDAGLNAVVSQKIPWTNTTLSFSSGLNQTKVTGVNGFQSWSSTPFSVGITQPIFRANTQHWDLKEQELRLESSDRKFLEAREDAAIAATNAFFDLYAAGANLRNAQANVLVNDTLYTLNKGRFEIGKIGENDLLQSELALLRARASFSDAKLAYERALAQFRITVNLPASGTIDLIVTSEVPVFDADTTSAVKWARANSSTINDATASEVRADRAVSEARWNGGMGGTLSASYGFNGRSTGPSAKDAYKDLLNAQRLSLSVQLPVWQWGAHGNTVDAARADRDAARANAEVSRAQVEMNARLAALQLTQARLGLEIAAKADTVANKRFDVAYNRYVIGKITIDNLYLAQGEKDQAVVAYAQALRAYWTAYFTLRKLTLFDFEKGTPIRE
jgi:outer membrane protein TolC